MSENDKRLPVFQNQKKSTMVFLCIIAMLIVGDIDYLTGYKVSLLVFYILPLGFATIYVGPVFAVLLGILSIAISICTDFWSGMPSSEAPLAFWNGMIALVVFVIAIVLLHALKLSLLRQK